MDEEARLLELCSAALQLKDFAGCLKHAEQILAKVDASSWKAWRFKGWCLFQLKRYSEAMGALRRTVDELRVTGSASTCKEWDGLQTVLEACELLLALGHSESGSARREDDPGEQLLDGWYRKTLVNLLESGELKPPTLQQNECSIMEFLWRGETPPAGSLLEWYENGSRDVMSAWDGGERNLAPGAIPPFPLTQGTDGEVFLKDQSYVFKCHPRELRYGRQCYGGNGNTICRRCISRYPGPMYAFPRWSVELPKGAVQPHPDLDVFYGRDLVPSTVHRSLVTHLDNLANVRPDFPMPKYHNVIDPNIAAVNGLWVPTNVTVDARFVAPFDILKTIILAGKTVVGKPLPKQATRDIMRFLGRGHFEGRAKLAGPIPDLPGHAHSSLYLAIQQVLTAATPLLGALKRPSLLLPGPLQVVVKAQRIHLKESETYEGIWHQDGLQEHVVAVVLYYYRASKGLEGGAMEIASRRNSALWTGDAGGPVLGAGSVAQILAELPRAKVPIEEGTLLVFSNYQSVHRVLPIVASEAGSRDFLAFFVIDQQHPLPVPKELPPFEERKEKRAELLVEQLKPRGSFGADQATVYSTGNGQVADVGWVGRGAGCYWDTQAHETLGPVFSMNARPPLGRGVSYLIDTLVPGWIWDPSSIWTEHRIGDPNLAPGAQSVFVDSVSYAFSLNPPPGDVGISDVCYWKDSASWMLAVGGKCWSEETAAWEFLEALS